MDWNQIFSESEQVLDVPAPLVSEHAVRWSKKGFKDIGDIGCGSGRHVVSLASLGFYVFACDPSDTAVQLTRQAMTQTGFLESCDIDKIIGNSLPIQSGACDSVICISSIHHGYLSDITEMLVDVKRVLKSGGELLIVVPSYSHPTYGSGNEIEPDTFITDLGVDAGIPHHFFSKETLEGLLLQIGFSIVEVSAVDAIAIAGLNDGHLMALANVS